MRSGPAPDPDALRRERDSGDWTILPADGRPSDPPPWPLEGQSRREEALWAKHWRLPQALMWERYRQDVEVALYVRNLGRLEKPRSPVILGTLVRQQADSLGLTTPGLRGNRWRIERGDGDQATAAPAAPGAPSAKDRLRMIRGGGAA